MSADLTQIMDTSEQHDPWPEPQHIGDRLKGAKELPVDMVPEPLRAWVADVSHRMQTPPDFVATGSVVMLASLIGTGCTIKPKRLDDWTVVPNLWGAAIGRPSVMLKTPCMKEALSPLEKLSQAAVKQFKEEQGARKADSEVKKLQQEEIKSRMKKAMKGAKSPEKADSIEALKMDLSNALDDQEEQKNASPKRFKTNEASTQKITELLANNPRGLLVFRDELMGLLSSWDKENGATDRAYFLEGWNGDGTYSDDKIGRGATQADHFCISLYGGIQPAKLQHYLYQAKGAMNDGLVQRLQLAVYPEEPIGGKVVDKKPDSEARERVFTIAEQLAEMDFLEYGAVQEEGDKSPWFRFDAAAQVICLDWLEELQAMIMEEEDPAMVEHLGKYRSLMPSLALVFHCIDLADQGGGGGVSTRSIMLALRWCDYLESHARRIYSLVDDIATQGAATLATKIRAGKVEGDFTARDIYRRGWQLLGRDNALPAIEELIEEGWIRAVELSTSNAGGRPKMIYRVNPKVMEL